MTSNAFQMIKLKVQKVQILKMTRILEVLRKRISLEFEDLKKVVISTKKVVGKDQTKVHLKVHQKMDH